MQTGNGLPKAVLSWNNTVRYRNWDLNLFFRSWLGQDVYNVTDMIQGVNCKITEGQNLLRTAYRRNKAITNTDRLMLLDYWLEKGRLPEARRRYAGLHAAPQQDQVLSRSCAATSPCATYVR